jgi:hypothetical protein
VRRYIIKHYAKYLLQQVFCKEALSLAAVGRRIARVATPLSQTVAVSTMWRS